MKHKKSHKKEKRKKEKKDKKKKRKSSSSSSSSSEDEVWVEKGSGEVKPSKQECTNSSIHSQPPKPAERDDWMCDPNIFGGITRGELRDKKRNKDEEEQKNILDKPGQSQRELNPYWRDGGSGLPTCEPQQQKLTGVGDQGAAWLKKALERAKEQAKEEGRSLESVAAERYGSLDKLLSMIREAEGKAEVKGGRRFESREFYQRKDSREIESRHSDRGHRNNREREDFGPRKDRKKFMRPDEEGNYSKGRNTEEPGRYSRQGHESYSRPGSHRRGWKKDSDEGDSQREADHPARGRSSPVESLSDEKEVVQESGNESPVRTDINSLNELGAKIIKAELMGNMALAAELKMKLQKAQSEAAQSKENVVILTRTDNKGFTQPIKGRSREESYGHKSKRKASTHEGGKRVRYFADDDKFSIQDMVEQEKLNKGEDQDEVFARLARKNIGRDGSERDMDDVFEETARVDYDDRNKNRERSNAIKEHRMREKMLEDCRWCLDSKMSRESLVTMGQTVYISVPTCQSLTEGHCLIVPIQHIACATALDENIWEEVLNLKKILVNLYLSQDEDVIFFESASYLNKYPHMTINCVPVPKEIGDVAPIYFKKAILECEMEWSTNKKLVDLSGKGVRRAVPKGLPYFSVDFGLQDGYAHVIEDQRLFPNNFAQEVIGGMLDLDHSVWRKPRREPDDVLAKKVSEFKEVFKEFDPYKKEN